jgi:CubicO group peptidase (beta-lactamase class C family)
MLPLSLSFAALLWAADIMPQIQSSGTEGLLIVKDGQVVSSFQPTKVVHIQSVTKPFVSLATGLLLKQNKLKSIDMTLGEVFPELKNDPKAPITLRHLLSHSSGIHDARDPKGRTTQEYNTAKDYLATTLKFPIDGPPGQKYFYNNAGVMLASAALERIAGEPLHLYLNRELFKPLNITSARWITDKSGRCPFFYGLFINAEDLMKIGQLLLNNGQDLITPDWINQSTTSSLPENSRVGLLWFIQPSAQPGQKPVMIQHSGDGGNWLIIFPKHNTVAVRLRTKSNKEDTLKDFPNLVVDNFIR